MLQQTIRSWIDQLLVYIGISADSARGIDQWVILAIIVAIGVGLDFLIRLLLLQVVRRSSSPSCASSIPCWKPYFN